MDSDFDFSYYNTYLTNDLMLSILSDKDNVVINGRIAYIMVQLPFRFSRVAFLNISGMHFHFTMVPRRGRLMISVILLRLQQ